MARPRIDSAGRVRAGRISLLALCVLGILLVDAVSAGTVEVLGRASTFVEPDRIRIQLGVERRAPTAHAAYEALDAAVRAVYESLVTAGIDTQSSVRTRQLQLWPERRSEGRGHRASCVVEIERRIAPHDPQSTTRFLDAALGAGASSFQGLSFDTDPRIIEETTARLLPMAVKAARSRAEALASADSRTVGRLVRVAESGVSHRQPPVSSHSGSLGRNATLESGGGDLPVHSGAGLVVTVTVEAVFELE